jgi:hypothetical protein
MTQIQDILAGIDENTATATATGATTTATQAAPGVEKQLFITGFSISSTATIAAGTYEASIRRNGGGTIIKRYALPATAFAPIIYEFKRPIRVPENQDADITVPSLGASAVVRAELYTITRQVTV